VQPASTVVQRLQYQHAPLTLGLDCFTHRNTRRALTLIVASVDAVVVSIYHSASPTSVLISANVRIGRWDNGGWSLGLINWLGNGHCTVAGCGPELSAADNCGDNQLLIFEFDERIAYPCD
jgi:hypothetical protein